MIKTTLSFCVFQQVASLIGLGLLYIESGHRHMAEVKITPNGLLELSIKISRVSVFYKSCNSGLISH